MKTTNLFNMRTLIIALSMVAVSMSAFAQQQQTSSETAITPKFGIKGGLNFANLYIDDVKDEHVKIGGNIGLFAKLPIVKGISIQPEILYTSKGAKVNYDNVFQGTGEYRFNLNYVETPLLMVFNVTPNFSLSAGGYISYLTSANIKNVDSDGSVKGVNDLKADDFHRFDNGLIGGVSVDIQNFTIGARYSYGLQTIGKSGNLSKDLTRDSKNSAASVFIGIAF
ncbi:MAG TPA: porin family protein [Cyclobacteriaceae bacterium]|nr:porin family protein [Cyclobacteriaceae bacterium]